MRNWTMKTLQMAGWAVAIYCAVAWTSGIRAAEAKQAGLDVGDKAPAFMAVDDQGKEWKSADHVGKHIIVVYFYPADLTGGCTAQACSFRDHMKKLRDRGVEVVGVSGDSAKNHRLFKKVHKLPFTLLADEDGTVAKKFGVPLRKGGTFSFKTKEGTAVDITRGVTASRWTFVIDKDGKIIHKNTKVSPAQDSVQILELLEKKEK
jgi:peroxiredoxin Q/BCP